MHEVPREDEVPDKCVGAPPLPHLTGKEAAAVGAKKRQNWVGLIRNAMGLLMGSLFLLWTCRYLFSLVTQGYRPAARGTIDVIFLIIVPLGGVCLIVFSAQGLMKWFAQRKENGE